MLPALAGAELVCAPVIQDQRGAWGWYPASAYGGGGAGNAQGGARTRQTLCTQGYAVTGFMAVATQDDRYLQDFRFECARIIGIKPDPLGLMVRPQKVDPNKLVGKTIGVAMEAEEFEGKWKSAIQATFPATRGKA